MPTLNINNDVVLFPSALVGIGTSNPYSGMSTKLYVGYPQDSTVNNADQFISIGAGGGSTNKAGINFLIYSAGYGGRIYTDDSTATVRGLAFDVLESGTFYNAMNITRTTTPNVLIGTTTDLGYKLFVNGSIVNQGNINSTGDPGLLIDTGQRLGFNESGVRSWTVKATGGNLAFNSGDGYGSFTFGASVTASSLIKSGGTSSQYLMADGSVSTIQTANVYTQTFFIPDTSGTAQWVKVGTWTAAQGGQVVTVEIAGHAGYNATTGQNQSVYIYMKTSNGSSVDPSGFAADSSFYTQGLNVAIGSGNVIWEANAAGVSATTYTLYVLFGQYTNGSQYTVTSRGGTWANVGTLTAPSGTTSSSTILLSEFRYSANNQLLTLDGNSSVLIGTTTNAGFKLDVDGTGRFTNLLQVNGPSGEARTDLHGISLYNANNDYRISLDTQSGTRGFIRYNVDTAGSTFHGHIFSAGDYNSSVTDLMLVRADGNVGIGTTGPATKLDITGTLGFTVGAASAIIRRTTVNGSNGIVIQGNANDTVSDTNPGASIFVGGGALTDTYEGNIVFTAYGEIVDANRNQIKFFNRSGVNTVAERMRINHLGNVGIGTTNPTSLLSVQGNTDLGNSYGSTTSSTYTTRISGHAMRYDASNRYGNYGVLILNADSGWTSSARRFMLTSGLNVNKFAIIRSVDSTTDPSFGDGGAISSGTADFVIDSAGNVGIGTTAPLTTLSVFKTVAFSTSSPQAGEDNIFLTSATAAGSGVFGGSIGFSRNGFHDRRAAAIASVQGTADEDQIGLAFFTHPTIGGADAIAEAMRISYDGNVGIGTTNPQGQLSLNSQIANSGTPLTYSTVQQNVLNGYYTTGESPNLYMRYFDIACVGDGDGTNGGGNIRFLTNPVANDTAVERMRITTGGSLLIGSTTQGYNPQTLGYLFGVKSDTTQAFISIAKSGQTLDSDGMIVGLSSTTGYVWMRENIDITFGTNNTTKVTIAAGGNVLIGTTTDAGYKLDVFGKTRIYTGAASGATTPDADTALLIDSAGNQYIELRTSSASSGLMQGILFTDNGQNAFIGFKEYTGGTAGTYGEALHLAYYDYSSSDPNNGIYFGTSNTPSDGVSNVQMFIKGNGNVGIGTTNPSTPLEIAHSNGNAFIVRTNDSTAANNAGFILANVASATPSSRRSVFIMDANGANGSGVDYTYFDVYGNGVTSIVNAKSDGILAFGTADSERMRITAAGNVGINTTAPQQLLHVLGATNGYAMIQGASDSGQAGIYFKKEDTTGTMDRTKGLIVFHTNVGSGWGRGNLGFCLNSADSNTVVSVSDEKFRMVDNGDFLADGDVVAYSTTISDARYKTNIQPIESALDKVNQMRGVSFDWTAVRSGREFGVIAQEIEQIAPEVVSEKELLNGDTMKTVSYTSLVPFLIESIKELTQQVNELKAQLDGLTK
jgi:hypothetical protein